MATTAQSKIVKGNKAAKKKKKPDYLPTPKHVSHTLKPESMTDNEWQTLLRCQVAEKENFEIANIESTPKSPFF